VTRLDTPPPARMIAEPAGAAGKAPAPEDVPSKTLATWVAVLGGSLGLHHVYLGGRGRWLAALYPLPTLVGLAGVARMRTAGVDDRLAWLLVPWLGVTISVGMLCAIVIGLTSDARWARRYAGAPATAGGDEDDESPPGMVRTGWGPVLGAITALMVGGAVLMGTIAFSVQKVFEW
jgi:hypothetical protein